MAPTIASAWPSHPGYRIDLLPCPYRARAWAGDVLLAETSRALRVEETDHIPRLYFPLADIRLDRFDASSHHTVCPFKGEADYWRLDGDDVLWTYRTPFPEVAGLAGFAAFYHERIRVELVDAGPGDDERDVTTKRFPTWGDAADLLDVIDVRPDGEGRYRGVPRPDLHRGVLEGSQLLAQAVVAAAKHAPERRAASAHMVFTRPADPKVAVELHLDERAAGRTFTTLGVEARQGDRLCAPGLLLLDVRAPDVIRHAAAMPDVPGPYECEPYDMGVTGRDLRIADGAYSPDPDLIGPPQIDAWVRFRDVPPVRHLHEGLLAQFTGHLSIGTALRPHAGIGETQAHRTLSTAIMAITLSFHDDVRADEWMLYSHRSTWAGRGMTHAECRVYTQAGGLVASFTVEAMVRAI